MTRKETKVSLLIASVPIVKLNIRARFEELSIVSLTGRKRPTSEPTRELTGSARKFKKARRLLL
eukprot:TRINITY_DN10658_c0_g1_i1.p1 TRINITY_DN10658_c0_g1~~TRINITY_DN10658_c0_g1_i1.p1  ORF type:complete len:64 (+),score=5.56 TRINITY_DN10658_c0_g1_i1:327-518(+)